MADARCVCCDTPVDVREDFCYGCGFHVCQPCVARRYHEDDDAHLVPGRTAKARLMALMAETRKEVPHA